MLPCWVPCYVLVCSILLIAGWAENVQQCHSAESEKLITLAVPTLLPRPIGVVDPSNSSKQVHLPWNRDSWCTVSPCLTVVNETQRPAEKANFERWLSHVQSMWTKPFSPLIFEQKDGMCWSVSADPSDWTYSLRNASHGIEYKAQVNPLLASAGCQHWVNLTGNLLLWHNMFEVNYGHWIHHSMPALLSLMHILGSSISWVAIPNSNLARDWLCWFKPELVQRIIFYPRGRTICSNSTTMVPLDTHNRRSPVG